MSVLIMKMKISCKIGGCLILLCLLKMMYHNTYWGVNWHLPCAGKQLHSFSVTVTGKRCLTTWIKFVWQMFPFAWALLMTYLQVLVASNMHIVTPARGWTLANNTLGQQQPVLRLAVHIARTMASRHPQSLGLHLQIVCLLYTHTAQRSCHLDRLGTLGTLFQSLIPLWQHVPASDSGNTAVAKLIGSTHAHCKHDLHGAYWTSRMQDLSCLSCACMIWVLQLKQSHGQIARHSHGTLVLCCTV